MNTAIPNTIGKLDQYDEEKDLLFVRAKAKAEVRIKVWVRVEVKPAEVDLSHPDLIILSYPNRLDVLAVSSIMASRFIVALFSCFLDHIMKATGSHFNKFPGIVCDVS